MAGMACDCGFLHEKEVGAQNLVGVVKVVLHDAATSLHWVLDRQRVCKDRQRACK